MWKRPKTLFLCILFLILSLRTLQADMTDLKIRLHIDNSSTINSIQVPYYKSNKKIRLKSIVENISKDTAHQVSKDFFLKCKRTNIRLISPSGDLLLPTKSHDDGYKGETGAPPLGYVLHNGKMIQAVPCKAFKAKAKCESTLMNVGEYYSLTLPGIYSVQYQFSTMMFNNDVCDLHNFKWQGLLKSKTLYFFYEGKTHIEVRPQRWPTSWIKNPKNTMIEVIVTFPNENLFNAVDPTSFRINTEAFKYKSKKTGFSYTLSLDPETSIGKILSPYGTNSIGQYPFILYGVFRSGEIFGGARLIKIVNN